MQLHICGFINTQRKVRLLTFPTNTNLGQIGTGESGMTKLTYSTKQSLCTLLGTGDEGVGWQVSKGGGGVASPLKSNQTKVMLSKETTTKWQEMGQG